MLFTAPRKTFVIYGISFIQIRQEDFESQNQLCLSLSFIQKLHAILRFVFIVILELFMLGVVIFYLRLKTELTTYVENLF